MLDRSFVNLNAEGRLSMCNQRRALVMLLLAGFNPPQFKGGRIGFCKGDLLLPFRDQSRASLGRSNSMPTSRVHEVGFQSKIPQ